MALLVIMIGEEFLYKADLQEGKEISIGSGKKDTLEVPYFLPGQLKCRLKKNQLFFKGKKIEDLYTDGITVNEKEFIRISQSQKIDVLCEQNTGLSEKSLKLPLKGIVKIGRSSNNSVVILDERVSRNHLLIRCEEGKVHVEDGYNGKPSSYGTYLNGKKITKALLKSGDVLDLMGVRIIYRNSELFFENVDGKINIKNEEAYTHEADFNQKKERIFRRSPRIREQLPHKDIVLAKPPAKARMFEKRRGGFVNLISHGVVIGTSAAVGTVSPALLAARAASLVSPIANMALGGSANKKEKKKIEEYEKKRQEKYGEYIEGQKSIIRQIADTQKKIIGSENPCPAECMDVAKNLKRSLWERRPVDSDYLDVRVGMGYEKLCANVKTPIDQNGFQMESDEIEELIESIIEETRIVDNVASRVHLRDYSTMGIVGQRDKVVDLLKNMIVSMTTAHFYEDVKIVGIFDKEEEEIWNPLRWLPHIWDENRQSRYLTFDKKGAEKINDIFRDMIRSRMEVKEDSERMFSTHYVVILGSRELATGMTLLNELVKCKPCHGITTIFAYNLGDREVDTQISYLPSECRFIINTNDLLDCSSAYDVNKYDEKFMFEMDAKPKGFDQYCRFMSAITVDVGASYQELPSGITFLQGMNVTNVNELNAWERWTTNKSYSSLATPIGVMRGGKSFDLEVIGEGTTGLIAGMPGAGKSELMTSWLLSLAINYHPYEVSFVIIDYKGGGMANAMEDLPHMIGKITNIDRDIQRPLASLRAEVERRQRIFAELGIKKISEYFRGFYAGKYKEPLPRILVVVDEFRQLKMERPEYIKELIDISSLGRSLGILVTLATQNPSGIVDNLLVSNSNFQICLKVQNAAASREMIGCSDAAKITQVGRAIAKMNVGDHLVQELIQTYWSGAPYIGIKKDVNDMGNQVRVVEMDGTKLKTVVDEKTRFKSEKDELQAISEYLSSVAKAHNIPKMSCPWLPELPIQIYFDDIEKAKGFDTDHWNESLPWLKVPIGMYDMPEIQKQGTQYIDFEGFGHYGIYGAAGTGKTTLMKSVLTGLCKWYTPRDVNIYILDFASGSMNVLEGMPHVGGVALSNEEEKFAKFELMINQMFEERKQLFLKNGVSSLKSFRENISNEIPAIVIAIDNIRPLCECYPNYEQLLIKLAAEGKSYGIYLLYTANAPNDVKYKIYQNIGSRISFELNDKSDYSQIVGKVDNYGAITGVKGRGFIKIGNQPVIFQAVNYIKGANEKEQNQRLAELIQQMNENWNGYRPERIPVMPEKIEVSELKEFYVERNRIPIGYSYKTIKPVYLDLKSFCSTFIVGTVQSGKSETLRLIARMLHTRQSENLFYVIDSSRKGLADLERLSESYVIALDAEATEAMLTEIVQALIVRQETQTSEKEQQGETFDATHFEMKFPQICILIDDIQEFLSLSGDACWKRLRGIVANGTGLGVAVIAAGRTTDIAKLENIDAIVSKIIAAQNGLAVSGTAAMHTYYSNNLGYDEKNVELKESNGLLYQKGLVEKIKLMEN